MIKMFCDRCNKEVSALDCLRVLLNGSNESVTIDLCAGCASELQVWLDSAAQRR